AVDLRRPEGLKLVFELALRSDVLVQNFRPGTAEKMGLGYQALRERHPRLVYCSISGFGSRGAGRDLPGFDQSAQAMSGLMSVTGTDSTGPLRVGIAIGDSTAGVFAALGIVCALYELERTGLGQRVETSLMESLLTLMSYQAQKYLSLGEVAGRDGNDHPLMFPQGTFQTQDVPITLASGNEVMWRRLCEVIGAPELAEDDRFRDNALRMRHRVELRRLIEQELAQRPAAEWLELINGAGIPASPIYSIDQALNAEVTNSLEMVADVEHASIGPLRVLGLPFKLGDQDRWLRLPPPVLGQHSIEVCHDLGLSPGEVQELLDTRTILDGSRSRLPAEAASSSAAI
ncbi:MAG: CoA transferase, partial [Chloroflexota bacterium]|nr:CoA transferase [Chloroflexota bacterium]